MNIQLYECLHRWMLYVIIDPSCVFIRDPLQLLPSKFVRHIMYESDGKAFHEQLISYLPCYKLYLD